MTENGIFFKFESHGKILLLDDSEYSIVDYSGLEATDYEIEKEKNINFIGERKKRKQILSRPISVEFDYIGANSNKSKKRQELISFFSPFYDGVLTVTYMGIQRQILYEVSNFLMNNKNVYDQLSCLLELECMDPAFLDCIEQSELISTWIGGWSFPFSFPIQMKERGEPKANVINSGHMETPVLIEFHGPATNPYVKNLTTGKVVKIETELTSDQVLYIDTTFGKNTVEIEKNGIRTEASQLISIDSRFWRLQVGDNMIEYGSDNALQDNDVVIRYHNRYLGV